MSIEWLTVREVAEEVLECSRSSVYYQLRHGKLYAVRDGDRWAIPLYNGVKLARIALDTRALAGHCPACGIGIGEPTFMRWKYDGLRWRHKCHPEDYRGQEKV